MNSMYVIDQNIAKNIRKKTISNFCKDRIKYQENSSIKNLEKFLNNHESIEQLSKELEGLKREKNQYESKEECVHMIENFLKLMNDSSK